MLETLRANGVTADWLNAVNVFNLNVMARSVTFPPRQVASAQVRMDNAVGNFPGYNQPSAVMNVTFVHETNPNDDRNACWMALEVWRAFVRAGQGFSFVGQGKSQLDIPLGKASATRNDGSGLIPDFVHDITVRLMRGPSAAEGWNPEAIEKKFTGRESEFEYKSSDFSLVASSVYKVRGAWLMDFQLGDISYESGNKLLEIKANFSINDYHLVTSVAGAPTRYQYIT